MAINYDQVINALREAKNSLDMASTGLGLVAYSIGEESRRQLLPTNPAAIPASVGWQMLRQKTELMLSQYHDLRTRVDTLLQWLEWRRREET